jgi:hypothetical protein
MSVYNDKTAQIQKSLRQYLRFTAKQLLIGTKNLKPTVYSASSYEQGIQIPVLM